MFKKNTAYSDWLKRLVKASLPLELQTKFLTLQPLTKEEAEKFAHVFTLASQAKMLSRTDDIAERLDKNTERIIREIRNEREKVLDTRPPRTRAIIDAAVLLYTKNSIILGKPVSMRQCFLHVWDKYNGKLLFDNFNQFYHTCRYDFENFYDRQALISRAKLTSDNAL